MKLAKIKIYKYQVLPIVNINGHNSCASNNDSHISSPAQTTPNSRLVQSPVPFPPNSHLKLSMPKTMVLTARPCCQPTRPAVLPSQTWELHPSTCSGPHLEQASILFSCQTSQSASKCCQLTFKINPHIPHSGLNHDHLSHELIQQLLLVLCLHS